MLIEEIKARKAEIKAEMEAEGTTEERLAELETEVDNLNAEERAILEAAEERKALEQEVIKTVSNDTINFKTEEKDTMDINSIEYRNAWLAKLQGKKLTEEQERAYAASDAANAIPTIVADKMLEKMKKLAPMLSEITLMQVPGNLKFVVEGTRNAASKHTENSAVTAAADTVVTVTLGAIEFMKVIGISKTASAMSADGFEAYLVDMLAGDIARAIDNYIINDSTNGITALTYTTGTNQVLQTATAGYGYADIMDLIALLPAAYDAEAKFLCNKKTFQKVKGILDTSKRPIFDAADKTLCGYPVLVDDYVTTANNALYLGRWTDVVGNLSTPIEVESDASSGFLSATINYRGFAAFDSKPAKDDGIVRLVTTA